LEAGHEFLWTVVSYITERAIVADEPDSLFPPQSTDCCLDVPKQELNYTL
jgi:hypothetical protein